MRCAREAAFDASAFIAEYRALGGALVAFTAEPGGVEWFGVTNPPSGFASSRAAEMRAELVADPRKEDAVVEALTRFA